jgi:competence protein ComEC
LEAFPVGLVVDPGVDSTRPLSRRYLDLLHNRGIPRRILHQGDTLCGPGSCRWLVLSPPADPDQIPPDPNNRSLVLLWENGDSRILFTGDIEAPAEKALLRRISPLPISLLKVAHHGSHSSTLPEFLDRFPPAAAVISAGRYNRYGHPHPETLDHLRERSIPWIIPAVDGAIGAECRETDLVLETVCPQSQPTSYFP